ncbi:hypothetical protein HYY70_07010 [Candidatus Woesearchaeota archaeon]|nr:hypothetical protein [Candidatus Woesearchaeota archaeon]
MKTRYLELKILLIISLFLLLTSLADAVSIGISPGRVRFDNVLKGGYSERIVKISTGSDEEVLASYRISGGIKNWVRFDPNSTTFTLTKNNPYLLKIIIEPPSDLQVGNYSGNIEFVTEALGGVSGRAGALIKTAVILTANLEVTGTEIIKCRAGGFSFNDAEIGFPLEYSYTVINDGNVRLSPTITLDVWDQLQENLVLTREIKGEEVLPTTEKRIIGTLQNTLNEDQYWLNMKANECKTGTMLTFSIVEKGAIADNGDLIEIRNKPWALTSETVQITAKFQNSGKRSVTAKFKGAIRLEDKIVRLIETEEVIVPSGETSDFDIFFIPEIPGRYTLTGRVVYNKKLTFEKGSVLNVNPAPEVIAVKRFQFLPLFLYLIIIITILFILRVIIKEKIKEKRKEKRKK